MSEIFTTIKHDLDYWEKANLIQNADYAPTMRDTYHLIESYWNSKYKEGDGSISGTGLKERYFYNIVHTPVWVAARLIDIDTKDLKIIATGDQNYLPVLFFEKELKVWLREQPIARLLNDMALELPRVGHIIVKRIDKEIFLLDAEKFICDPKVDKFQNSDFILEVNPMTPSQLNREGKEKGWNEKAINQAIASNTRVDLQSGELFINVYEYYNLREDKDNHHIVTGIEFVDDKNKKVSPELLYEDTVSNKDLADRYKEMKWENVKERHEGRGFVELLFEPQIAMNEHTNMHRRAMQWTSKRLFWTADNNINKNAMSDVDNGYIFQTKEGINPIANEERNLSAYQIEDDKWNQNVERRTFSHESIRGEQAPSGTPLGAIQLQAQMSAGFYEHKREEFGIFVKEILMDWVIPNFRKNKSAKHIFNLMQDDADWDRMNKLIFNNIVNETIFDSIIKNRRAVSHNEIEFLKEIEREKFKGLKNVKLEIPDRYYSDLQYKMDFVITGENIDVQTEVQTLQYMLQIAIQSPQALQSPFVKKILQKMANLSLGLNPMDLDFEEAQSVLDQAMTGQGGRMQPQRQTASTISLGQKQNQAAPKSAMQTV